MAGLVALGGTVAMWPILAPLAEVLLFASKSGPDIEEIVRLKEPLQACIPLSILTCMLHHGLWWRVCCGVSVVHAILLTKSLLYPQRA